MKIIECTDYNEMSKVAAGFIAAQVTLKPNCVLGLATGSTPIGMYEAVAEMGLDFSKVTTFNLDEYYPIEQKNSQSYHYFMTENFYSKVNLKKENIFIPCGEAKDPDAECKAYEEKIEAHGGIDLQVLGIGQNGHIGFNEPDSTLFAYTHVTGLTQNTIEANSRFFDSIDEVPTKALTMGVATILKSKRIILLASGANKADAVRALTSGIIDPMCPASLLAAHNDVTIIADKAALGR
ncbi:MAG: glucosamine-6-phosphate deaminase [Clostridia bacterium]|nr:glucosamine-6-phosphate deaminase [Clostridia bacterium]